MHFGEGRVLEKGHVLEKGSASEHSATKKNIVRVGLGMHM
jgi:hypothetical protein